MSEAELDLVPPSFVQEGARKMGEKSWIINVNDKVGHLADITETEMKDWEQHSIYRLPACVTDLNKNAYKPRAISFGPYHHGEPNLKPMEVHKERALLHFLNRSEKSLEDYIDPLREVLQDLKDAYDILDDKWLQNSDAFLELMIQDGCFMIEVLRTSFADTQTGVADYAHNDPIFSNHGKLYMLPYIKRDMLMIENQLPMLLLKTLLAVDNQNAQTDEESINNLILKFYFPHSRPKILGKCMHVLDAYRRILLWTEPDSQKPTRGVCKRGPDDILSARELEESGIRIRKSDSTSLNDIHFDCDTGILRLPQITVDDVSETMFLNLVAFERFHVGAGNEVTDYIFFMDEIIDNAMDVNILQRHEIIENAFGSDKAVAKLFNSLTQDVALDEHSSLTAVRETINGYCKTKWHKWRAALIQTYFRSPWALISVVAAIVLFALTIAQTAYGALQYYEGLDNSPSPPPPPPHRS
ncbi:UPF0481 protein At3g47200-like [Coffea arabica]|uniref:UPF0481 protein At3g47200-like n=1 Tax=Coffea arabica TaxID=13443 RepID=A0A6P6U2E8_COFAR